MRIKPLPLLLTILAIVFLCVALITSYLSFVLALVIVLSLWFGYRSYSANRPTPQVEPEQTTPERPKRTVIITLILAVMFVLIVLSISLQLDFMVASGGPTCDLKVFTNDIYVGEFFVEIQVTPVVLSPFATSTNLGTSTQLPTATPTLTPTPIPTRTVRSQPISPMVNVVQINNINCERSNVEIQDFPALSFLSAQDGRELEEDPPHRDKQNIRWVDSDLDDGVEFAYIRPPLNFLREIITPLLDFTSLVTWSVALVCSVIGYVFGLFFNWLKDKFISESTDDTNDNDDPDEFDIEIVKQ